MKNQRGISIIELLVTIAVIGILCRIMTLSFVDFKESFSQNNSRFQLDAVSSIRSVADSMSEATNRRGAELTLHLPCSPVYVACRKVEFEELIYCLITNALQASVPSKTTKIKVELLFSGEMATISVTDNGSGISEQSIDSIFDCFFTTKSEENGTGLGLAIVRHIVESHGGTVCVSSEVNIGSTFVLKLPLANGEFHAETYDSIHC